MAKKRDMPSFLEQDRPEKVKEIYRALKREYGESMPAEVKARIASAKGSSSPSKRSPGPPYSGPLRYKRKGGRYVKKSSADIMLIREIIESLFG